MDPQISKIVKPSPTDDIKGHKQVDPKNIESDGEYLDSIPSEENSLLDMELNHLNDNLPLMPDVDFSHFPFSHPRVFSRMLLSLDSVSLLRLRLVCSTWLQWMNVCKVWSKVLPLRREVARLSAGTNVIRNMRLDRMEEQPWGTEEQCRELCIKVDRVAGDQLPSADEDRIHLVEKLHLAVEQKEICGPVLGPVEVFVRVRVDHPLVNQIIKENIVRYLNSILIDETDSRALMLWVKYPVLCTEGALIPVEFKESDEALLFQFHKSIVEEDEKRSRIEAPVQIHPSFPTVLELLEFDDPIIKEMLIEETGIDKIFVCPRFNDILSNPSCSLVDSKFKVQGVGTDGKVCEVNMSQVKEGDVAVMGYHMSQCFSQTEYDKNLPFWGGPDIRHNWPEFEKMLKGIDSKIEIKCSPPKLSNPLETKDCVARLAARGILISNGNKKPVDSENSLKPDDEPFYPFTSLINSDLFFINPVNEQLYASLASRGLSLSLADTKEVQCSGGASEDVRYASEDVRYASEDVDDEDLPDLEDRIDGSDEPGDVIIYEGASAGGFRAELEVQGMFRVDGGVAILKMYRVQEHDEEGDAGGWETEEDWETDEDDEDDSMEQARIDHDLNID